MSTSHHTTNLRQRRGRILRFFVRAIASAIFWDVIVRHLGGRGWASRTALTRYIHMARRFRLLAIDLGGVMIKLGQFVSSRVDILPKEIIDELASLQDEVPPESFDQIQVLIESELGRSLSEVYMDFEREPIAAASLGQAHRVKLKADGSAIVKVQRPGIEAIIAVDLAALRSVLGWLKHYGPIRRRADLDQLFDEFRRILYEELDYLAEGRNAERFTHDFKNWPDIRIPKIYWEATTRRVLTMENIGAIKISDVAAYQAQGVSASAVAQTLFKFYLQQIFVNGFFHADPHSGNLFVQPKSVNGVTTFTLNVVDFGMVGSISARLKAQLRDGFIGIATRDVRRVVQAMDGSGWLLPSADRPAIERAAQNVFARFWGISMGDLKNLDLAELRGFASEFRSLLYQFPFQIPSSQLFLGRALGILSGLATQIDAHFNVFAAAMPFAQDMIADEATSFIRGALDQTIEIGKSIVRLPVQADRLIDMLLRGEVRFAVNDTDRLIKEMHNMNRSMIRLQWTLISLGLLLTSIALDLGGHTSVSPLALGAAIVAAIWFVIRGLIG